MNITANAAGLNWKTNNHGVWKALVKDMAPNSSVTFSDGLTGTVAGRQVTVESPSMPTGFMTYTTDDDTTVFGGVLYGAGTVSDSLEAVGGGKTVRMGSYTFTGNETWTLGVNSGVSYNSYFTSITGKKTGLSNLLILGFVTSSASSWTGLVDRTCIGANANASVYVKSDEWTTPEQVASGMAGKTIYYELAEPTASTETAQPMSLEQGSDTIGGGSFSATYEGTEYEIQLVKGCKYIHRDEAGVDHYLTPSATTQLPVKGGVSKVIDLRRWFGFSMEPTTLDAFYKLYPTWKNYDIPYIEGQFVNYKGTGVQTIGFNAYNHATGTAELLGGNKYQICGTYTSVSYVDQWGNTEELELDAQGIFTPTNNGTLTVVGGNATDTCVHLVWSGYKNFGEREYQWEPFVRNVHNIDVTQYFTETGMGSILTACDELYVDRYVTRIVKHVFTGDESFENPGAASGYARYGYRVDSDMTGGLGVAHAFMCNMFTYHNSLEGYGSGNGTILYNGGSSVVMCIFPPTSWGSMATTYNVTSFKAKIKELYDAGNPLIVYYASRTPVTTQLPSPINLTYPVNDFGTEQSLPVNTADLVTTDLHSLIRYNTDCMRMNTQLSEIFPTVRSLARQEQAGEIMKTDDTAPNATVGNAYNLIDRNAAGTERQFTFDTSGGAQDIADGTAVKTPGSKIFPFLQQNLDQVITVPDEELVTAFLDMVENHKMIVENSGLLTVAALKHLNVRNKRVVAVMSGGNMDVITMSQVVQNGLIARDRIFTVSVLLPDRPGELVKVSTVIANTQGNVIKLEHNQFYSTNRHAAVELRITMEAFGTEHKEQIISALQEAGFRVKAVHTNLG
jgi:ACT domain-containing protein